MAAPPPSRRRADVPAEIPAVRLYIYATKRLANTLLAFTTIAHEIPQTGKNELLLLQGVIRTITRAMKDVSIDLDTNEVVQRKDLGILDPAYEAFLDDYTEWLRALAGFRRYVASTPGLVVIAVPGIYAADEYLREALAGAWIPDHEQALLFFDMLRQRRWNWDWNMWTDMVPQEARHALEALMPTLPQATQLTRYELATRALTLTLRTLGLQAFEGLRTHIGLPEYFVRPVTGPPRLGELATRPSIRDIVVSRYNAWVQARQEIDQLDRSIISGTNLHSIQAVETVLVETILRAGFAVRDMLPIIADRTILRLPEYYPRSAIPAPWPEQPGGAGPAKVFVL